MPWIYLLLAGLFECGWPFGLKIAEMQPVRGMSISAVCIGLSGIFLYLAQRAIPIGIAYAIWTAVVGTGGTFLLGAAYFKEEISLSSIFGLILIVSGIALLKLNR